MMRFTACLLFFVCLSTGRLSAQSFYAAGEYGISAGASQYFGDLNEHYGLKYIRPAAGAFVRHHFNPYISGRLNLSYTKVGYDDKFNTDEYSRQRNLQFRSDIYEFSAQAEFNFMRFATGDVEHRFTPYLTGGVGVFYYNPYTTFNDKRTYLKPLGTEGQNIDGYEGRKYTHFSACFPVGLGVKYWIRPGMNIGVELADRLTLTDYLDDVSGSYVGADKFTNDPQAPNPAFYLQDRSPEVNNGATPLGREGKQRGNSSTKDQYMYLMINLSFQLKVYKCPAYMNPEFMFD